jgi:hypothetical protein
VELRKGSGVFITAAAKNLIILEGSKGGPQKLLTALIHELFKHKLKEVHGTATIRPQVLQAIFSKCINRINLLYANILLVLNFS